jgi:hypothetical protein
MAETYNVYFGYASGSLELVSAGQSDTNLQVPFSLDYDTEYQWRVDAVDGETTTGDVWTFTTMVFDPPTPSGTPVNGLNGIATVKRLVVATDNKVFYET